MTEAGHGEIRTGLRLAVIWALVIGLLGLGVTLADRWLALRAAVLDYQGLVFEPNAEFEYETFEFSVTVRINNLGFRGPRAAVQRRSSFRVVAIGDSFTFGWGVQDDEAWPRLLERRLRDCGLDVEVFNLGRPGAAPRHHAEIAETALPMLKPDLVLVALLQGEDVASGLMFGQGPPVRRADRLVRDDPAVIRCARGAWPNVLHIAESRVRLHTRIHAEETRALFRGRAAEIGTGLTGEMCLRMEQLDPLVRAAFEHGYMLPGIVFMSMFTPGYFMHTMNPSDPRLAKDLRRMAFHLGQVDGFARSVGAPVLAFSVPHPAYCTEESNALLADLGFSVSRDMFEMDTADLVLREACERAKLPFVSVAAEFRMAARVEELFFPVDLHFNARGHEVYADLLFGPAGEVIKTALRKADQGSAASATNSRRASE